MPKNEQNFELPKMNPQIQGTNNIQEEAHLIDLSGQLMVSNDTTKIGKNFKTVTNMRYKDDHPVGILGMEKVNYTPLSSYPLVRSAFQFAKDTPPENHIIVQAFNSGMTACKLYENTNASPVDPQLKFETGSSAYTNYIASRSFVTTPSTIPDTFTLEIEVYFDNIGTYAAGDYALLTYVSSNWGLHVAFASNGLYIRNNSTWPSVGDIVNHDSNAAWQTFRFQVSKGTISTADVDIYLDNTLVYSDISCNYQTGGTTGTITYTQKGESTNDMLSHVKSIKIGSGLGILA
jgi:hypothetical protein